MRIICVDAIHVIALFISHHLESELVMITEEHCPLTTLGNRRSLIEDINDRESILHLERHEHPRHEWEMEVHMRLISLSEVRDRVLRPLICFREEHAAVI